MSITANPKGRRMRLKTDRLPLRVLLSSGLCLATIPALTPALLIPTAAHAAVDSSQSMKLLKLAVTGNKQVPTSSIEQAMTLHVGERVTRADLATNFNAVVDVYRKANVGAKFKQKMTIPRPGQVRVEYIIEEQAPLPPQAPATLRLDQVTFEGNKKIPDATIRSAIPLKPGDIVTNDKVASTLRAIVGLYKKAGIGVKVTPSASYPQPNHAVVDYKIEEQAGG